MIVRLVVVDPRPKDPRDDIVVYQVPENGRAHELLVELLDAANIQHVVIEAQRRTRS